LITLKKDITQRFKAPEPSTVLETRQFLKKWENKTEVRQQCCFKPQLSRGSAA